MRLPFAIFIYIVTVYQPAIAVTADEDVKPAPSDNGYEQSGAVAPSSSSKVTRGQMLYENHCTSCHESTVYIRTKRKATNYKEVGNWVKQRADWLNLGWGIVEKQEVLQYLNERYYKYPLAE
jgi:cytochrome c5